MIFDDKKINERIDILEKELKQMIYNLKQSVEKNRGILNRDYGEIRRDLNLLKEYLEKNESLTK